MSLSFSSADQPKRPPSIIPDEGDTPGSTLRQGVSQYPCVGAGPTLSDEEREASIVRAGRAMEKHMAAWQEFSDFGALGDAHRARRSMELLIAGRSPEQVASMEAAQRERMAREPGAERA